MQQSIIHVYHDDLFLDEEENIQAENDNLENNDDAMEIDNDGGSNSNQATPRRSKTSENTIPYEDFRKIRDKLARHCNDA